MLRLIPIVVTWILLTGFGLVWMAEYDFTPSLTGTANATWPDDACLVPSETRPTLLLFVHPKCPCTRASLTELSELLTQCGRTVEPYVVLVQPTGTDNSWIETDLHERSKRIPGVVVVVDEGAAITNAFNAKTSGEVLLYDKARSLRFHGGITSSRGHEGDNVGRTTIAEILLGDPSMGSRQSVMKTPVFGCSLQNSETSINE